MAYLNIKLYSRASRHGVAMICAPLRWIGHRLLHQTRFPRRVDIHPASVTPLVSVLRLDIYDTSNTILGTCAWLALGNSLRVPCSMFVYSIRHRTATAPRCSIRVSSPAIAVPKRSGACTIRARSMRLWTRTAIFCYTSVLRGLSQEVGWTCITTVSCGLYIVIKSGQGVEQNSCAARS